MRCLLIHFVKVFFCTLSRSSVKREIEEETAERDREEEARKRDWVNYVTHEEDYSINNTQQCIIYKRPSSLALNSLNSNRDRKMQNCVFE